MRHVGLIASVAALVAAVPAAAQMDHADHDAAAGPKVSVRFSTFAPPRLDVLTGETVQWANESARAHDVVGTGVFDSGNMRVGATYAHRFDAPGAVPYVCSLHPFMTGQVDVHDVLLDPPAGRAGSGKPYVLTGRAAAGISGTVTIGAFDAEGFTPAGTAAVGADGTFRVTVVPRTSTTYRARVGASASPPVQVLVLDRKVAVRVAAPGRRTTVSVAVAPASAGQTVVLQLRLKERFGWWPVARATLGKDSTARFRVTRRGRVAARVLLTQPDGATELARSRTVHVGPVHRPGA